MKKTNQVITSAALYFKPDQSRGVPLSWYQELVSFCDKHELLIDAFGITAPGFANEGVSYLSEQNDKLSASLSSGMVESLHIYSDLCLEEGKYSWKAMADFSLWSGVIYFGIDSSILADPKIVLLAALKMLRDFPCITYGIGYQYLFTNGPDSYAAGVHYGTVADAEKWFTGQLDLEFQRISAWSQEMMGARRYLTGMFRGAYPASVLSNAHVDSLLRVGLLAENGLFVDPMRMGNISPLTDALWLWELSDNQLSVAEAELEKAMLLIM